jgi:hypothetical protein
VGRALDALKYHREMKLQWACPLGLAVSLGMMTGCATSPPPPLALPYHARSPVERVPGAEKVKVNVSAEDLRANKAVVCGRAVRGQWYPAFTSTPEPGPFVQRALKAELAHRGFDLDSKGVPVVLTLAAFYCERKEAGGGLVDALGGVTDAEVDFDVSVYSRGRQRRGQEIYSRHARGVHEDKPVDSGHPFFEEVAQGALQMALERAMQQLFSDPRFVVALLSPAAQAPPPPPTGKTPPAPLLYDAKAP